MPKIMISWLVYNNKPVEITMGSVFMLVLFFATLTYFTIKSTRQD